MYRRGFRRFRGFDVAIAASGFSASTSSVAALYASQNDRVSAALRQPVERLARETEGTRVRLSAFGQVQSATAAVQSSARNLQDAAKVGSAGDARKAAEAFVQAYNSERAALANAAGGSNAQPTDSARARIASSQLERLVADNASAFRDAGIRVQQDGSLTVDAKALESAYATNPSAVVKSLGDVGRAAEATATRQLSNTGSVGAVVNNLNNRLQQLETRDTEVRARIEETQRAVESSARRYGFGAVGAGAYLGIFGL